MSSKLECVFCAKEKDDKVHLFSEEAMKKCRLILRKRKFHNLKYQDIVLPSDIYDSGYHSSCYRSFTALKKNFFETSENVVPSETQSPVH